MAKRFPFIAALMLAAKLLTKVPLILYKHPLEYAAEGGYSKRKATGIATDGTRCVQWR